MFVSNKSQDLNRTETEVNRGAHCISENPNRRKKYQWKRVRTHFLDAFDDKERKFEFTTKTKFDLNSVTEKCKSQLDHVYFLTYIR